MATVPCAPVSDLFWSCLCLHQVTGLLLCAPVSHDPLANAMSVHTLCVFLWSFQIFILHSQLILNPYISYVLLWPEFHLFSALPSCLVYDHGIHEFNPVCLCIAPYYGLHSNKPHTEHTHLCPASEYTDSSSFIFQTSAKNLEAFSYWMLSSYLHLLI